jgi:hypothetical protein
LIVNFLSVFLNLALNFIKEFFCTDVINFELFFLSDSFWFHAKNTPAIIIVGLRSSDPDVSL